MLCILPPTFKTFLATNQIVASCVNTDIRLDKITRESRHTQELRHLLQDRFACATCTDFVPRKNRTALNSQPATTWFAVRQV